VIANGADRFHGERKAKRAIELPGGVRRRACLKLSRNA